MAKQIVHHHQPGREPKPFVLIKKHANNTADFGLEDGTVIVSGCPIGPVKDQPHRSYCVIAPPEKTKTELKKIAKDLRDQANALKKALDEANAAAEVGKAAENAEALAAAALEAEEAYYAADKAADEAEAAAK